MRKGARCANFAHFPARGGEGLRQRLLAEFAAAQAALRALTPRRLETAMGVAEKVLFEQTIYRLAERLADLDVSELTARGMCNRAKREVSS